MSSMADRWQDAMDHAVTAARGAGQVCVCLPLDPLWVPAAPGLFCCRGNGARQAGLNFSTCSCVNPQAADASEGHGDRSCIWTFWTSRPVSSHLTPV